MSAQGQEVLTSDVLDPVSAAKASPKASETKPPALLPALVSAALHWLSYFPVNWGWLGWVALVPLLALVRSTARPRRVYFAAWLGGLAFYLPALHWFYYANNAAMVVLGALLAIYCALFWPLGIWLLRRLDVRTRLPMLVTVPVVWTALEYLRAHFMTGFPWYFLGHTQHEFLGLIQMSDVTGAYGVTFLVAAMNALAFEWLSSFAGFSARFGAPKRPTSGLGLQTAATLALFAAALGYGWYRFAQEDFAPGPRLALIQGNVDPRIRPPSSMTDAEVDSRVRNTLEQFADLINPVMRQQPELLVWPETSYPDVWWDLAKEVSREDVTKLGANMAVAPKDNWQPHAVQQLNGKIVECLRNWPADNLIGLSCWVMTDGSPEHGRRYNSAVLVRGSNEVSGYPHYDKIHRVPFGEYLPLRDWLPFITALSPYDSDYSVQPGEHFTRFPLRDYHFGVLICFEDTDPYLARQYLRPGADGEPPVDFLVNISNDGWFGGSAEHDQHLAICRFRAVECRRSIGRSVNMGISAVIDGSGRIIALPGKDWKSSKNVGAVVVENMPIDRRQSLYARWGDWLPTGSWLVIGLCFVWSALVHVRER